MIILANAMNFVVENLEKIILFADFDIMRFMPRILHIGKYFPPFAGGMECFLADLMAAQTAQKNQVAALVHDHGFSSPFRSIQAESYQNHIVYRTPSYGRVLYAPISPHFPFWLNHVIRQWQPDILHFHLPNTSAFWALFLPQAKKLPWILHWHSDVISSLNTGLSIAYYGYKPFEQSLLSRAQAVIATSPPYLASSRVLQTWQAKSHVIPLGIDLSRLPESSADMLTWAKQQWQPNKMRLLAIGRLTYYKGYEVLIKAVAQLSGVQLFIVGKGEEKKLLEQLIKELNLTDKVRLLGYCEEKQLRALLISADCLCLPSLERTEAFGVVLLEAMRYAKAIIASNIVGSGVTWVVEAEKTGLLVSTGDATALAHAIQHLHDNDALRVTLGLAGQQRFFQQFDITGVASKINELYNITTKI